MSDNELRQEQDPTPKKPKKGWTPVLAWSALGILIVLVLINFSEIKSPLDRLFSILTPITIGLVLAYILNYFLRFFEVKVFKKVEKRTLNRALSMICAYLVLALILAGVLALILPQLIRSVEDLAANAKIWVDGLLNSINNMLDQLPITLPDTVRQAIADILNFDALVDKLVTFISDTFAAFTESFLRRYLVLLYLRQVLLLQIL